jgi:hypothetical protein
VTPFVLSTMPYVSRLRGLSQQPLQSLEFTCADFRLSLRFLDSAIQDPIGLLVPTRGLWLLVDGSPC